MLIRLNAHLRLDLLIWLLFLHWYYMSRAIGLRNLIERDALMAICATMNNFMVGFYHSIWLLWLHFSRCVTAFFCKCHNIKGINGSWHFLFILPSHPIKAHQNRDSYMLISWCVDVFCKCFASLTILRFNEFCSLFGWYARCEWIKRWLSFCHSKS